MSTQPQPSSPDRARGKEGVRTARRNGRRVYIADCRCGYCSRPRLFYAEARDDLSMHRLEHKR